MAAPDALTACTLTAVAGDQAVDLAWTYATTGQVANELFIEFYSVLAGVATKINETYRERTIEPATYRIPASGGATWRVRATPVNRTPGTTTREFGPSSTPADVVLGGSGATLAAHVQAASLGVIKGTAQGFLHGLRDNAGNPAYPWAVPLLHPKWWRFAGEIADDTAARALGVSRTQVISDFWYQRTQVGGVAPTPWSNWTAWETFVHALVLEAASEGWPPDYWDIWNEPNSGFFGGAPGLTVANFNELFKRAYQQIKSADADAKIVAPSQTAPYHTDTGLLVDFGGFPLDQFLTYCAANSVVIDAVAWHENDVRTVDAGDLLLTHPFNMVRHISDYAAVIAAHPTAVAADVQMFINEYTPSARDHFAANAVGYFKVLEDSNVAQANRAVWSQTGIGALLTNVGARTSNLWVHIRYGQMIGQTRMRLSTNASFQLSGVATRDDSTETVRALFGRHWSGAIPSGFGNATVALTIDWPYDVAPVEVLVQKFPTGGAALPIPVEVSKAKQTPSGGTLTVNLTGVQDGDAFYVEATDRVIGDLNTISVRGHYEYEDGSPAAGTVTFSFPTTIKAISDVGSNLVIVPRVVEVTLDVNGEFAEDLPATDDPDVSPTSWAYKVVESITGAQNGDNTYQLVVPVASEDGILYLRGMA